MSENIKDVPENYVSNWGGVPEGYKCINRLDYHIEGCECPEEDIKGRLTHCILEVRPDQKGAMFTCFPDGTVGFNLDGYAIVPKEKYLDLKQKAEASLWQRLKKVVCHD
jgi:hypothetical protein